MTSARVVVVAIAVALVVVALGFFLARGLHPHHTPAPAAVAGNDTSPSGAAPSGTRAGAPPSAHDLGAHAAATHPRPTIVLSAPWGSGPGQLGHRHDPESAGEGPMSLFVDRNGVTILDNVNRRVARFDPHGAPLHAIPLDNEAAQDLARAKDRVAVLDRLHDKRVSIYDTDSMPSAAVSLAAAGFPDAAAVTGIFGDKDGAVWGEREHSAWQRIADPEGMPDTTHLPAPGRPTRTGGFVNGAIVDRAGGRARVSFFAALDNSPTWQATVDFGAPILFLALLDADASGRVYVGAHTGHESAAPPYAVTDESLTIIALDNNGNEAARMTLPAPPPREESFRDLYVGDDGTIYWMRRTATGVVVEAYRI